MADYTRTVDDAITALDVIYSPSASDARNFSFETAGANKGVAYGWNTTSGFLGIIPATFGDTGTDWMPWEAYAKGWRMPYLVHPSADTVHTVSAPAAGTLGEAITLMNELLVDLNGHLETKGGVHLAASPHSVVEHADATDLASAIELVNLLKTAFNLHAADCSAAHARYDTADYVTTVNASDESSTIALVNALRTGYVAHIARIGFGRLIDVALFLFTDDDLADAVFHADMDVEQFDFEWAIGDQLATVELQHQMVSTDDSALWAIGHVELLDNLSNILTELGIVETYEASWLLPGDDASWPNDKMVKQYMSTGDWEFPEARLQLGVLDDFHSGWGADEFYSKYWQPVEGWKFNESVFPPQIVARGFGVHVFGTLDLSDNTYTRSATVTPAPLVLWATVTEDTAELPDDYIDMVIDDSVGGMHNLYMYCRSSSTPPNQIWPEDHEENRFRETRNLASPEVSYESLYLGIGTVWSATMATVVASGTIEFRGGKHAAESFDDDWLLTLTSY